MSIAAKVKKSRRVLKKADATSGNTRFTHRMLVNTPKFRTGPRIWFIPKLTKKFARIASNPRLWTVDEVDEAISPIKFSASIF